MFGFPAVALRERQLQRLKMETDDSELPKDGLAQNLGNSLRWMAHVLVNGRPDNLALVR